MNPKIEIIHSTRKTLSLEIKSDLRIILRAPNHVSDRQLHNFLQVHRAWIDTQYAKVKAKMEAMPPIVPLTPGELAQLEAAAREYFPARVAFYAEKIGVSYGRISIRKQRTRWGSCSSKGNLNFNCLLMLTPPEILDSVIVHELCHRKEMNHSPAFYALVLQVFPQYESCRKWLKENGNRILKKLPIRTETNRC